jgi:hypothetical protein
MVRLLFLLLVVVGALAAILATVFGLGLVQTASIDDSPAFPVVASSATQPATEPASAARPQSRPATLPSAIESVDEPPALEPPVVVAAPRSGVILLKADQARLNGPNIRHLPPENDIGFWDQREDFVSWLFTPPTGIYHVDVISSGAAESGGNYAVWTGREHDPRGGRIDAVAKPTGGWNDYKPHRIGRLALNGGPTVLEVRPAEELKQTLMNLRRVELVPLSAAELRDLQGIVAKAPVRPDGPPTVIGLTLVDATNGRPIAALPSGSRIDLANLPPVSIQAEVSGSTRSVQFLVDDDVVGVTDSTEPFVLAGKQGQQIVAWKPERGTRTLFVTPFTQPEAQGIPGARYKAKLIVSDSTPIEISPAEALVRGTTLRVEFVREPVLTQWTQVDDYVEWLVAVPATGRYRVEALATTEPGGGGEAEFKAGDFRQAVTVAPGTINNGWIVLGEPRLARGKSRLALRPASINNGKSLMTIRMLRLVPLPKQPKDKDQDED